ncbi:MAG: (2Fe-2S) ferredoxin domain-containing protein [Treponema sp.]|jgi:NADH:ubiquinone oxidoreductase subunit E|nr:(2Fe-2S) ferredoxin domain-containing protein [Treponema sp.]
MTKVTVCIGSSCHLKGSRQVVEQIQYFIKRDALGEQIELSGAFCMGKCNAEGVSVTVNDAYYAVNPAAVQEFFDDIVLKNAS